MSMVLKKLDGFESSPSCIKKIDKSSTSTLNPKSAVNYLNNLTPKSAIQGSKRSHLPPLSSPQARENKPRFSIHSPMANRSIESSIGNIISSLTPNSLNNSCRLPRGSRIDRPQLTEGSESLTDIERILDDQKYFDMKTPFKDQKDFKNLSTDVSLVQAKTPCRNTKVRRYNISVTEPKEKLKQTTRDKYFESQPNIHCLPQKTMRVLDIPKTAFGVHKSYHEIDLKADLRVLEIEELSNNAKPRYRSLSLVKDQELRHRILSEIILEKKQYKDEEEY